MGTVDSASGGESVGSGDGLPGDAVPRPAGEDGVDAAGPVHAADTPRRRAARARIVTRRTLGDYQREIADPRFDSGADPGYGGS